MNSMLNDPMQAKTPDEYMDMAAKIALDSTCKRGRCGTIIIKDLQIIGEGYNSPPLGLDSQCRCEMEKTQYHKKITDKTCCVHAEQRAIMEALKNNPSKIIGSTLYFIRLDSTGNKSPAGKPYCTHCSKLALDCGIKYFALMHAEGVTLYDTEEYNNLSYKYEE